MNTRFNPVPILAATLSTSALIPLSAASKNKPPTGYQAFNLQQKTMMNDDSKLLKLVPAVVVVGVAVFLGCSQGKVYHFNVLCTLFEFGAVIALMAMAAVDYRLKIEPVAKGVAKVREQIGAGRNLLQHLGTLAHGCWAFSTKLWANA